MEIEGHPTEDIIEELENRGAVRMSGSTEGPDADALKFVEERLGGTTQGFWLFLPHGTFMTGFDELPL